jgi:adenylate kinase
MEKLKSDQQKDIINKLVNLLSKESPDLYYTDSSTIAALVHDKIKTGEGGLTHEQKELVKNLSSDDILILLSYKSNCC